MSAKPGKLFLGHCGLLIQRRLGGSVQMQGLGQPVQILLLGNSIHIHNQAGEAVQVLRLIRRPHLPGQGFGINAVLGQFMDQGFHILTGAHLLHH